MSSRVDIVIVNWNAGDLLAACLGSLEAAVSDRVASVVVVDNASTDGSADLETRTLPLHIVEAQSNLGFGRACNLGAARGTAEYLLFLNPDTEVERDTIESVARFMDCPENSSTAVTGIRLVGEDGQAQRHCARFPGWRNFVGEALGLSHVAPRIFPPVIMREFDHDSSRAVDHVIGAFYFVRRKFFEQAGGFDESFFVYLEDLDLSRRIADLGGRRYFLAEVGAFHRGGGTSDAIKARRLSYATMGRLRYASKHLSAPAMAAVWLTTLLFEPFARSARALLRGSFAEMAATWQGFGMVYRALLNRNLSVGLR